MEWKSKVLALLKKRNYEAFYRDERIMWNADKIERAFPVKEIAELISELYVSLPPKYRSAYAQSTMDAFIGRRVPRIVKVQTLGVLLIDVEKAINHSFFNAQWAARYDEWKTVLAANNDMLVLLEALLYMLEFLKR